MANDSHHSSHAQDEAPSHGVGHIVPFRILIATGVGLLFLTWLTVKVREIDLGDGNIYIALGIAAVKASLVALFFMHLKWDRPINAFIFVMSISFVALFISFALTDSSEYKFEQDQYRMVELKGGDAPLAAQRLTESMQQPEPAHEPAEHE